ncbi:MAG: hypothetical protein AB4372_17900 [Xenococcus sp. (in: cyanobacteria)]
MTKSITLEEVLDLAKQLSPLDRIRLIEQITPHLKRDLIVSPPQPRKSLRGIWKDIDISETDIAEVKAEISKNFPREDINSCQQS